MFMTARTIGFRLSTPTAIRPHYEYDLRDRQVKTTDALGNVETQAYDGNNNRVSLTDKNGHVTTFAYDVQNRPDQNQ